MKRGYLIISLAAVGAISFAGYKAATRRAEFVKPGPNLLFNGWGLTPVGQQIRVGDMTLKMIYSPDHKQLVSCSQGFNGVHLTTTDLTTNKRIQSTELDRVFNGLAFSPDGKTLYVSGGNSGKLMSFSYDAGQIKKIKEIKGPDYAFISGIAVSPTDGTVYACNESFNQLYALKPETLEVIKVVNTGSNPYTCVFGEDKRHLYVSNWGSNTVSVIDTKGDLQANPRVDVSADET